MLRQPSAGASIPEFEGLYEASDLGRVRSVDRLVIHVDGATRTYRGQILKPRVHRDGHLRVQLHRQDGGTWWFVHRLVLLAFVGPPEDEQQCLHGNGRPADNRLSNLRWGTAAENKQDDIRLGVCAKIWLTECPLGHPLLGDNLNPWHWKNGARVCRACVKARHHASWRKSSGLPSMPMQEIADRLYEQIVAGILDGRSNQASYPNRLAPHLYART